MEKKLVDVIENKLVLAAVRRFTEQCDLVIAPTCQVQRMLQEREWEATLTVMPTGLPDCFYSQNQVNQSGNIPEREQIRETYGNGKQYLLCTAARLSAEKNLVFLLRSLAVLKENIGDRFLLLVLGDGPQRQELERLCQSLEICENVTFLGTVPNDQVPAFHNASDLFLFASKSETQGLVLLEAMAGQSPVVAVKAAGSSDVVRSGQNGYITSESEEEFARRVQQALGDQRLYEKLSEGAGETAQRYKNGAIAWMAECNYERTILRRGEDGNESRLLGRCRKLLYGRH